MLVVPILGAVGFSATGVVAGMSRMAGTNILPYVGMGI